MHIVYWLLLSLVLPRTVSALDFAISEPSINSTELVFTASSSAQTKPYYLQATLRREGETRYFGSTQNNTGSWIPYLSNPDPAYITANFYLAEPLEASWSGQLHLQYAVTDPNYSGPGNYELKVRLFTGGSSSPISTSSNLLLVALSAPTPPPSPSPTSSSTSTPTPSPVTSSKPSASVSDLPLDSSAPSPRLVPSPDLRESPAGTVAGAIKIDLSAFGNPSPLPDPAESPTSVPQVVVNKARLKIVLAIGLGLVIVAVSSGLGYRRYLTFRHNIQ